MTSEFWPAITAYTTVFTPLTGAAKSSISFRNRVELHECFFTNLAEVDTLSTSDSFDAYNTYFRDGIQNNLVTVAPSDYTIRLYNCVVETVFDFGTASAVSVQAYNCTIDVGGSNIELTPNAAGLGGHYTFKNCNISTGGNFQIILTQTVIPVGPSEVRLTMENCSCFGGTTLGAGSSYVSFSGAADILHFDNFVFLNNAFSGTDFGVGSNNAVQITSGGNQGKVAPGHNANITVTVAYTSF